MDGEEEIIGSRYAERTRQWTERVPIGLGLCPWAGRSRRLGRLRIVVCAAAAEEDVPAFVRREARRLYEVPAASSDWSTALVVCPHVTEWQNDFDGFDRFVQSLKDDQANTMEGGGGGDDPGIPNHTLDQLTLVAFHPNFIRWHALPNGVVVGSRVHCHRGMSGFEKSRGSHLAQIVEIDGSNFGKRKVKVRFECDDKDQCVPIDWLVSDADGKTLPRGEPLPDNEMHRAPHPTIHLIRNADLASLSARDVSRVKRKNAQLLARLGWDGVQEVEAEQTEAG